MRSSDRSALDRQMINAIREILGLDPLYPIKQPLERERFGAAPTYEYDTQHSRTDWTLTSGFIGRRLREETMQFQKARPSRGGSGGL